jgi:hypothetical protein
MEHSTRSRVMLVDCWFFVKSSVIAFIMVRTSLLLTHSSSSSLDGGGSGCCYPCFGGMVNRKQRATETGDRLVKTKCKTEGGITHFLKHLIALL